MREVLDDKIIIFYGIIKIYVEKKINFWSLKIPKELLKRPLINDEEFLY